MVNFTLLLTTALTLTGLAAAAPKNGKPGPFVKTDGTRFTLDGKDFTYAGSNAYYFPFYNVSGIALGSR
jgi:mannan endo-1,4-beta-mannosidase